MEDQTNKEDGVIDMTGQDNKSPLQHIPVYSKVSKAEQADLDTRIATLETQDPDSATFFGKDSMAAGSEVTQKIYDLMSNEENGVFRKVQEQMLDTIKGMDLELLQEGLDGFMREGGKVVKHNKGTMALTMGAMLMGQFWVAAATGGVGAAKEYVRRKREVTTLQNSPEVIEERIRECVHGLSAQFRECEKAAQHAPRIMERMNAMAHANRDIFVQVIKDVAAGREKLRRVEEEEIPALEQKATEEPSFENSEALENARKFHCNLERKLKLLEVSMAGSIEGTATLALAKKATEGALTEINSIMVHESQQLQRAVVTAGLSLDTYRTTRVVNAFRDKVGQLQDDTVKITLLARNAAEDGRFDNPERLKKIVQQTQDFRVLLEKNNGRVQELEEKSKIQRDKMVEETGKLIKEMSRLTNGESLLGDGTESKSSTDRPLLKPMDNTGPR